MSNVTSLSSRFRISLPKAVREAHGWRPGQRFAFLPKGGGVAIIPVVEPGELSGIAKGANGGSYRERDNRH